MTNTTKKFIAVLLFIPLVALVVVSLSCMVVAAMEGVGAAIVTLSMGVIALVAFMAEKGLELYRSASTQENVDKLN